MWSDNYGMSNYRQNVVPVNEYEYRRMREELEYYRARGMPSLPMPKDVATPKKQINKLLLLEDL